MIYLYCKSNFCGLNEAEHPMSENVTEDLGKERVRRQKLAVLELNPAAVDTDSPVPAYLQIEQDIRRQILSSGLSGEARLPRETELAELYGISRMTMRNALARLEEAQLVRRAHGIGTLVNLRRSTVACDLSLMKRIQTQIRDQGFEPGQRITQRKTVSLVQKVADGLKVEPQSEAFFFERVITVDRTPTALIRSWVPVAEFPGLDRLELQENSVWKTISEHYSRNVARTSNQIELVEINAQEAQLLNLEEGERTLSLTGIAYDGEDTPVEYSIALWGPTARIHFEASV